MSRVEKQANLEQRIVEVKGEVVAEVRRRTRRARPWLTCSLVLLALIVGMFVWAAWSVAATGLIRVPVFTSLAYEVPRPERVVSPGVSAETVLQETFERTLTRRLYEGGGTLENRRIEVQLHESSLTASLRSFAESAGSSWIETSQLQVAIDPEGVELFVPLRDSPLATAIRAAFELRAQDGLLVVGPTDIEVGSWRVPDVVIAVVLKPLFEAELKRLNGRLFGYATISRLDLVSGELIVEGELSVEIEKDKSL